MLDPTKKKQLVGNIPTEYCPRVNRIYLIQIKEDWDKIWWQYLGEALTKRWRTCRLQGPCHSWAWHLPARHEMKEIMCLQIFWPCTNTSYQKKKKKNTLMLYKFCKFYVPDSAELHLGVEIDDQSGGLSKVSFGSNLGYGLPKCNLSWAWIRRIPPSWPT